MKIYCLNIERYIGFRGGETLLEIAERLQPELGFRPICARVNNKTEDLGYPIYSPKQVEFLDLRSASARRVYLRSQCMLLYKAVSEEFPDVRLKMEHSVSRGTFCRLFSLATGELFSPDQEQVEHLEQRMRNLVERDLPFIRKERLTKDVVQLFREQHLDSKVMLLETTHQLYTTYYMLDSLADSYYGPLVSSTGQLGVFALRKYKDGILLLGPDARNPEQAVTPTVQEKMFDAFTEYLKFNRIIRVSDVGELNRAVEEKKSAEVINVAEAMHDKLLGRISDEITRRHHEDGVSIVLIAGPSSSGKTTSTKRLAVQLMTSLMTPKMISLDDYFVDREKTPLDEAGEYDYESLYALDLERLNSDLTRLLNGEEINLPTYSFEFGRRMETKRPLRLEKDDILLIEGIHGLKPELISSLPKEKVFKVYVSALTTLAIDDHNWISTTDTRLLRRIVRDHKYRHTSALSTIKRWPSVSRGEEKWIFPFQENADATFNSSLIFELAVMKSYAEPLLREVPRDTVEYSEADRLLRFLDYFKTIPVDLIPSTSLLREFLGGSSFKY